MSRIGVMIMVLTAVLFYPWLNHHRMHPRWNQGDTDTAVMVVEEKPRVDHMVPVEGAYHVHAMSECPHCWRMSCHDMHLGVGYPVKPVWVPTWVVRWTLLVHVVPDHAYRCA